MSIPRGFWVRDDVVTYVIDHYAGVRQKAVERQHIRPGCVTERYFEWQEHNQWYRGNSKAFLEHVYRHFSIDAEVLCVENLDKLLRSLGEKARNSPSGDGSRVGEPRWNVCGPQSERIEPEQVRVKAGMR